jgi:hypothetical protein
MQVEGGTHGYSWDVESPEQVALKVYPDENNEVTFSASVNGIKIDWGDGKTDVADGEGRTVYYSHKYDNQKLQLIYVEAENLTKLSTNGALNKGVYQEILLVSCPFLRILNCEHNELTTLNASNCQSLKSIDCCYNQLKEINTSGCMALTSLICSNNQLKALDLSTNTALVNVVCYQNQLEGLDLGKNPALSVVNCDDNQIVDSAINALYVSLPTVQSGKIYVKGNPCTKTCDPAIAKSKGWWVYPDLCMH